MITAYIIFTAICALIIIVTFLHYYAHHTHKIGVFDWVVNAIAGLIVIWAIVLLIIKNKNI